MTYCCRELAYEYNEMFPDAEDEEHHRKQGGKKLIDWAKKRLHLVKPSPYSKLHDQPADPEEMTTENPFNINQLKMMLSSPVTLKVKRISWWHISKNVWKQSSEDTFGSKVESKDSLNLHEIR